MNELSAGKLWGLRRLADPGGVFKMLAVDQRPPIKNLVAERRGVADAPYDDVSAVKRVLLEELGGAASAVLLDPHYAYATAADVVRPEQGLLLTLEDSIFDDGPGGRRSSEISDWSVEKIKRTGADAVKVLAWYRPDADAAVNEHQQAFVARIGDACRRYDIPFIFELLVYPLLGEAGHTTDYVEQPGKRTDHVLESVATFAAPEYGVDLFKLESPIGGVDVPPPDGDPEEISAALAAFREMGRLAGRPWVMLSAGVGKAAFRRILELAFAAGASGFLAGRAIWWEAFQHFPDLDAMRSGLADDGLPYFEELNTLADREALPWTRHPSFGDGGPRLAGGGPGFRPAYEDFGGGQ